ncbi:MAG: hypothetical protein NW223_21815 [Hyphomicrobiaceae bacterium]|nr:hypothetical protein [Hyphomicrobiaceae bacterium]
MRLRSLAITGVASLLLISPAAAADCGGGTFPDCGGKEWCSYAADNACGSLGKPGVCMPRPQLCNFGRLPVCGCDGNTYSNACIAHASGVSVSYAGTCRLPVGGTLPIPKSIGRPCPQVVHCGIKNRKPKEYGTRCAAEDDGATNIVPKGIGPCPIVE